MSFIGQKHIVDSFREKIRNNKLSHAFALTGPAGIGKRTLGHYLSKMLLCENTNDAPCNMCRSCKTFDAGVNPRFTLIRKETQKILIRQIRALIDHICVRPAAGNKVYLIEEADLMTVDAQNCLLKTAHSS
jgi:DNA polymerase-3 subunit delta'